VTDALLLWALPDSWTQFETLAPELDQRIEDEMRRRFEESGVDEHDLTALIRLQIDSLREFAADGVVLLATRSEARGGPGDAPSGLSLALALAKRPASGTPGDASGRQSDRGSANSATFLSEAIPFPLEDTELVAFTTESRADVSVPGFEGSLSRFQAQAFVLPKGQAGMAVVTVTTFDRRLENEARAAARSFANTLCFVTVDDNQTEAS